MPELPEIETIRNQLSDLIIGQTIQKIEILNRKSFSGDERLVVGEKITGVIRYGKMLVFDLSNRLGLVAHLKMSGQLIFREHTTNNIKQIHFKDIDPQLINLPNKHTRVIINFKNGDRLFFNDLRKFGWIKIMHNEKCKVKNDKSKFKIDKLSNLIEKLGPEPMGLNGDDFYQIIHKLCKPIKTVIMDQERLAGVGNIYANEALFLSGIHPEKKACKLSSYEAIELLRNLKYVLNEGIKHRGASRNNFRDAYGRKGRMQEHFRVYNREGKNCPNNCAESIKRIKLGGRGTFYCPDCQRDNISS